MHKMPLITTILSPLLFFLLLFVYVKLAGPIPFSVNSVNTTVTDTFSVTGTGKVSIAPNEAVVTAGVQAKGSTPEQAQNQMNSVINKVSEGIKDLGIPASDIQTQNYNINPEYDYSGGTQRITGYSGNTNLTITVKDVSKVNQVIDTATANGANVISGADFRNSDDTKAMEEARIKAVADAKLQATNIAKISGFKLGRIVNYQESTGGSGKVMPYAMDRAGGGVVNPTQLEPGTNEVVMTVTLSYEIQ